MAVSLPVIICIGVLRKHCPSYLPVQMGSPKMKQKVKEIVSYLDINAKGMGADHKVRLCFSDILSLDTALILLYFLTHSLALTCKVTCTPGFISLCRGVKIRNVHWSLTPQCSSSDCMCFWCSSKQCGNLSNEELGLIAPRVKPWNKIGWCIHFPQFVIS